MEERKEVRCAYCKRLLGHMYDKPPAGIACVLCPSEAREQRVISLAGSRLRAQELKVRFKPRTYPPAETLDWANEHFAPGVRGQTDRDARERKERERKRRPRKLYRVKVYAV